MTMAVSGEVVKLTETKAIQTKLKASQHTCQPV